MYKCPFMCLCHGFNIPAPWVSISLVIWHMQDLDFQTSLKDIGINSMALFLEVLILSWLGLYLHLQELWSHLLPINTRPACLYPEVSFFCGRCDWGCLAGNILVFCDDCEPTSVSWRQLLCGLLTALPSPVTSSHRNSPYARPPNDVIHQSGLCSYLS